MATREENLKKINAELEKLSDEQLEEIAGGTWHRQQKNNDFYDKFHDNSSDASKNVNFPPF